MECTEFFKASGWRCTPIEASKGVSCLYVSLPVTFATGHPCDIYVFEEPGGRLRLSDDGDTLSHFHRIGYALEDKRRWKGLISMANEYGFELTECGELTTAFPRERLGSHIDSLLQLYSALIAWERDHYAEGDQDFSLTEEVERLLHFLEPGLEVVRSPRISTPTGEVSFDLRWGSTYVDALRPNAQSINSRLRKVLMLQSDEDTPEMLFVIDDRPSRLKAEAERDVLGRMTQATLLSDLQHRAASTLPMH